MRQRYPSLNTREDVDGVVLAAVLRKIQEVQATQRSDKSLMQDKHATPAEGSHQFDDVFLGARPQSLIEERTSDAGMDVAARGTEVLRQYTPLEVNMKADYVKQLYSLYPSQVFPFSFPYLAGLNIYHAQMAVVELPPQTLRENITINFN